MKIIILLCLILFSMVSTAGVYIGTGASAFNSHAKIHEVGYINDRDFDINLRVIEGGFNKNGPQHGRVNIGSISYRMKPSFLPSIFFLHGGVAYVDNSNLVDNWNFKIGAGVTIGPIEVELAHHSSAGINDRNTGIDSAVLRYRF